MKKVASPALAIPAASWRDAYEYFGQWKNGKVLIGTTLSWFFLVRNLPGHESFYMVPNLIIRILPFTVSV